MLKWLKCLIHGITELEPIYDPPVVLGSNDRFLQYIEETDPFGERACKKRRLEQQLKDAKWILEYEEKLNDLRKKTATQRDETARSGGDIRRLKRLDAYLEHLGRTLSLD